MYYAHVVSQIGERLLKLREAKPGLQAAHVARAIGVTPSALSQWERGAVKNIRPENLLAAARYFSVSIVWLISGVGPREHVEAETEAEATALTYFRKLSAAGQVAALSQLEWMAQRDSGDKGDEMRARPTRHLQ